MKRDFLHYNMEDKASFIGHYDNKETQESYGYVLEKVKGLEEFFKKDLYDFSFEQIEEAMHKLSPSSLPVARMNGAVLTSYISWAIDNNKRVGNINPIKSKINTTDWYRKFIDPSKKNYITLEELEKNEKFITNYQDKIVPRLLFEGVGGIFASEILNLTDKDYREESNKLRLNDERKGERYITVSEGCINMIKKALDETDYHKSNGESESRNPVLRLVENNFVVKTASTNDKSEGKADRHTVYRRISSIAEWLEIPFFTTKSVQRSGMIYMAYKLMKERNKEDVDREVLNEVAEQFNVTKINNERYNYSLLEEYINTENINKLYEI